MLDPLHDGAAADTGVMAIDPLADPLSVSDSVSDPLADSPTTAQPASSLTIDTLNGGGSTGIEADTLADVLAEDGGDGLAEDLDPTLNLDDNFSTNV